ncbi:hypothetical protein WHR41_01780 [Cladosporium halotolerans]|uniref:Uncharacterized protein n=1 Tax=Cladosporium halotolerans TaxID=1052096 RepID=A0AB34L1R0_9PEZI
MAEDDSKGSGRSRFKSKWGKILKHSDDVKGVADAVTGKKNKHANSQEDVDAFLKPSVDRAAANKPRLDVSIAQRWPDPNDVRQAGALPPDDSHNVNGWRKRRRKEGLTVGFAKTVPEIIGRGGDETMDPPSDVAARKSSAASNRSAAADSRDNYIPTERLAAIFGPQSLRRKRTRAAASKDRNKPGAYRI